MDTNRLRQFSILAETVNFRKASELLGISHSGLSKSMRALEEEVGQKLFTPQGRGIVVTDAGRRLAERAGPFFSELERLLGSGPETRERSDPVAMPFRLGAFEVFTASFLARLAADEFPERALEVHDLSPGRLEEALLLERIDAGITYEPIPRAGIEYIRVARLAMAAFKRRGSFPRVPVTEIPFIAPATPLEGVPTGVRGSDAWTGTRLPRRVRYRVDSMTTGIELLRNGLGAIFIPRFAATLSDESVREELRCEEIPLPKGTPEVTRDVFLVKRESTPESPEWRKLARALRGLL